MKFRNVLVIVGMLAMTACAGVRRSAFIDDLGRDSGYMVVSVDGHDAERLQGRSVSGLPVSAVPYVRLSPGWHTLTAERKPRFANGSEASPNRVSGGAYVSEGRYYRIKVENGVLELFEDKK